MTNGSRTLVSLNTFDRIIPSTETVLGEWIDRNRGDGLNLRHLYYAGAEGSGQVGELVIDLDYRRSSEWYIIDGEAAELVRHTYRKAA